ncbi:MAG: DNA alkylation repair protein [Ruminococcaceae bacterium]|nr:DNA alkylation repair protein [Oscillospiraceae bacterium]
MIKSEIRNTLLSMGEEGYKDFSASLMPTVDKNKVIGIRIPVLRKYAKRLENYEDFLAELPHEYFEENNLHAFLIEREKDFDKCIEKLDAFLPYVDNWSTCDSMKPPILKKEPEKLLRHIKKWISSKDVYAVRYGINLLMSIYLDDNFDKDYLSIVANIKSHEYYVNMMRAWYFATALAKRYEEALPYIENKVLDEWTHNKTIQKAVESFRITKEQKLYLKSKR